MLSSASSLSGLGLSTSEMCSMFASGVPCDSNSTASLFGGSGGFNTAGIADLLLGIGLVSGGVIIFGGWLINSVRPTRRKVGCILVVVTALVGGLTTFGGLLVGIILAAIGVYFAFTYRPGGDPAVIGLGPVGSLTLGSRGAQYSNAPAGAGPLNYCIKCGSQIRPGAVFCGACGARLVE